METDPLRPREPDEAGKAIGVADFVVSGKKVAIYIDGATFHRGERLRRDRFIRKELGIGSAAWRVVELTPADLGRRDLVDMLKA